jgi:hypothetical protein
MIATMVAEGLNGYESRMAVMGLPLGWWHQVTSLDISMSFSYSNLSIPNDFVYANPTISQW